jgi:hypothetical protein
MREYDKIRVDYYNNWPKVNKNEFKFVNIIEDSLRETKLEQIILPVQLPMIVEENFQKKHFTSYRCV